MRNRLSLQDTTIAIAVRNPRDVNSSPILKVIMSQLGRRCLPFNPLHLEKLTEPTPNKQLG